jgi:uncharacterized RDD family membrane protein YckC
MSASLEQQTPAASVRREETRARASVERGELNFERLRAPFSLRCGAILIDYIILIGVLVMATMLARMFGDVRRASSAALMAGYIGVAVVALLNFVIIAGFTGRTLGKWIAGLRIECVYGTELSFKRVVHRHLICYPFTLVTLGLGFLLAAFNSRGRALHDLMSGTIVVRDRGPRTTAMR